MSNINNQIADQLYKDKEFNEEYNNAVIEAKKGGATTEEALAVGQAILDREYSNLLDEYTSDLLEQKSQQRTQEIIEQITQMTADLNEIFHTNINTGGFSNAASGSGSGEDEIESALDYLDKLRSAQELINKEYEAMRAYDEDTKTWTRTEYFDKMRKNLQEQLVEIQRLLDNAEEYIAAGMMEEADVIDLLNNQQELQVELNNLDDEELEDKISLLETQEASLDMLIKMQEQYLMTADTEEEFIERQKELNNLKREQLEYEREIYSYRVDQADRMKNYYSGQAYSNAQVYDVLANLQKNNIKAQMDSIQEEYNQLIEERIKYYMDVEGYEGSVAYNKAKMEEDARNLLEEYWNLYEEYGDIIYDSYMDKIDELDVRLNELELTKPDEWSNISQINPYYDQTIDYLEQKLSVIKDALRDTENLTDEQIQELTDQYNDIVIAIKDAQKQMLQDTIDYQDSMYNALVDWVNEYKEGIQDIKDEVQDYYDDLIEDLQDEADERDKINELLELQQNLLDANQEKERVYREGRKCPKTTISVKGQGWLRPRKDFIVLSNKESVETAGNIQ